MPFARALAALAMLIPPLAAAQAPAEAPSDAAITAVAYFESRAAAAGEARAALERYRAASERQAGLERIEFFEQVGRAGHFAVLETWRDQASFDARDSGAHQALLDALDPLRVSGFDERLYKTLSATPDAGTTDRRSAFVITHVDVAPNPATAPLLVRLAEGGRHEAGNRRFDVLQHTMRANHFTVVEHWASQEALEAHVAAAATREYRDTLQPLTGSPLDERLYVEVAPRERE